MKSKRRKEFLLFDLFPGRSGKLKWFIFISTHKYSYVRPNLQSVSINVSRMNIP